MKDKFAVISRLKERVKPENKIFVEKNLQISQQISHLLLQKGWSQKVFAQKLNKKDSEVSKWLTGLHNLTLQSISKMEAVLESEILITPLEACEKYKNIEYITLKVHARSNDNIEEVKTGNYHKIASAKKDTFSAPLNLPVENEDYESGEILKQQPEKAIA
jgi:transcriptional regulator with XRE-family HTH domain